ncbi:MAG TPA: SDR family NAD(P)-dependent oxidoreductase, partial [Ilumatobacteraceae bacterium]|nr:SDR family NAD(P)-dependent oxidoreductase [Ilumatobacteraceae bacterium]
MGTYTPSFEGEVAFVTGSSGGMGRACVLAFVAAGAQVASCDVNDAGGQETVELAKAAGGRAIFIHADVSDGEHVSAAVQAAV